MIRWDGETDAELVYRSNPQRGDVIGEGPDYGGVPHCGPWDCMHFEDSCRICGRAVHTGATICKRHGATPR